MYESATSSVQINGYIYIKSHTHTMLDTPRVSTEHAIIRTLFEPPALYPRGQTNRHPYKALQQQASRGRLRRRCHYICNITR